MSSVCEDLEAVQQQMLANVIARMRKEAKAKKETNRRMWLQERKDFLVYYGKEP